METQTLGTTVQPLAEMRHRHHPPFRTAAVLGAGTMGAQIAAHLANAGLMVDLLDVAPDEGAKNALVDKGLQRARKSKPDPFFAADTADRIRTGNFDEHIERISHADWIIEAVVERFDVKQELLGRVEQLARNDAVISTNTSGLRIAALAEGRSETFRRRFLGTHFFNPPRYLKLLEVIPSEATDLEVVRRVAQFGRLHLGKGVVVAKDTPYFIGNRVGVYAMLQAMRAFEEGYYTIEEVDLLTGPLTGRPKSATLRTADVVGLDVLNDVAENLYAAVPEDESREAFQVPDVLRRLVEEGALGQKSGAGFYKKSGKDIQAFDPKTGTYRPQEKPRIEGLEHIAKVGDLAARITALYEDEGRAGAFFRENMLDVLGYSARRIPEIADSPADIDRAICWGFGWEMGPFQIWDALGFERVLQGMKEQGIVVPDWVLDMRDGQAAHFYKGNAVYVPTRERYVEIPQPEDEISLAAIRTESSRVIWENEAAALLDLGEGVALYEFRSKANTLGQQVMEGLREVIDRVERTPELRGLVVGNEGKNFSVGANLGEMAEAVMQGDTSRVERYLEDFQRTIQRVRYAAKPVVVAVHERVLGGGCEMVMACPHPVAAAESYIGLVELGVGLIPAGTGTMQLAAQAAERSPNGHPSEVMGWIQKFFENVAMAKVATSAVQAQQMGYLAPGARIVMNEARRLHVAREEVLRLSNAGYLPPPVRSRITVLGQPAGAAIEVMVQQYLEGGFITEYDRFLAGRLAYVLTGGALTAPQDVHEDYLLELEREVFMQLVGQQKTQERIEHILKANKPLRN